jgi:hypothetical protein
MTSIRNTITTALSAQGINADGYGEYVDAAAEALTEREYQFSEQIIDTVAYQFGVSKDEVQRRVEQLGMAVRPAPEPEPEVEVMNLEALFADDEDPATGEEEVSEAPSELVKAIKKLTKRVKKLEKVASRAKEHGYV